ATALTLRHARERNVDNFYFFCQHITLLPTLRSLLDQPENGIDAFLAPGHVSMVIGTEAYGFIASDYHRPLVVAGFEPLDLLQGAVMLVEQTIAQRSDVENQYRRVVRADQHLRALGIAQASHDRLGEAHRLVGHH
ncbi:hypothetical protein JTL57_34525, partial [Pseudomonas aeruginosa]|nr:hypothetical protein [Pseudomonas aeruginosa]